MLAALVSLALPASAAAFTVTNANDSGAGSLRDAITKANAAAGLDTITFDIGSGAKTIAPKTPLPAITDPVEILGPSQPGFSSAPLIELSGANAPTGSNGLLVDAGGAGSVIAGVAVVGWKGDGVQLNGGGSTSLGDDWLGIGPSGVSGDSVGLHILGSSNNTFDGRFCTLSCSSTYGIVVGNGTGIRIEGAGATGNAVRRSLIGITHSVLGGSVAHANTANGVDIASGASANQIGGTTAADRNVISSNPRNVFVETGAHDNTVEGDYIGTDFNGAVAMGGRIGVQISAAPDNVIGGTASGAGNLISGNGTWGVFICGLGSTLCSAATDATGNAIEGNLIGTNAAGSAALGNGFGAAGGTLGAGGVFIQDATGDLVGDAVAGAGNAISGNKQGVTIVTEGGLVGNDSVRGNLIGLTKNGSAALGNQNAGVQLGDANNSTVGGGGAAARNVISGNAVGVQIVDFGGSAGATAQNEVQGNYVGTDASGTVAVPNTIAGVSLSGDTHGNDVSSNVVSGNRGPGVQIVNSTFSPSSNTFSSNDVGTDASGTAALPNSGDGVSDGGLSNTYSNDVVSANAGDGLDLQRTGDTLTGNVVGTNAAGTAALGNAGRGVVVAGSGNSLFGNVISGNGDDGVDLVGPNNLLTGNDIGTNAAGTAALANNNGVFVGGASNTVGSASSGNLISGNRAYGVFVTTGGDHTIVQSNRIGTDAGAATALPNGAAGVRLEDVSDVLVGGATSAPGSAPGNVISGNTGNGVEIALPSGTTPGETVSGNYIGLAGSGGAALGNGAAGILVSGVPANTISGNVVSGNAANGVVLTGTAATGNKVQSNLIGTTASGTAALANGAAGVRVAGGASGNRIGGTTTSLGNRILFNGGAGVFIASGIRDAIRRNAIGSNGKLGIDLAPAGVTPNVAGGSTTGPNLHENHPVLSSASSSGGKTTIAGSLNSTPNATGFTIEFFSSPSCDPSGFGEGLRFLGVKGAISTDAAGNASFTATFAASVPAGSSITATATDAQGDTSEFSRCRTST